MVMMMTMMATMMVMMSMIDDNDGANCAVIQSL